VPAVSAPANSRGHARRVGRRRHAGDGGSDDGSSSDAGIPGATGTGRGVTPRPQHQRSDRGGSRNYERACGQEQRNPSDRKGGGHKERRQGGADASFAETGREASPVLRIVQGAQAHCHESRDEKTFGITSWARTQRAGCGRLLPVPRGGASVL
jgi:hypothetical protein